MPKIFVLYSRNKNDFELRKHAAGDQAIIIGGNSSTLGNARDLLTQSDRDSVIITNSYHISRVKRAMGYYGALGTITSAEGILKVSSRKDIAEPIKTVLTIVYIKIRHFIRELSKE